MTDQPFAIWLTGLPASGKTTIANLLAYELRHRNIRVQVLDSDRFREILTPDPSYSTEERTWFYKAMALVGKLMVENGINVILAATAHKRIYRQQARECLPHLIEIYVRCSLETCMKRDQKGIYVKALSGEASTVPGIQEFYEEPEMPAMIIDTDGFSPMEGVQRILDKLVEFDRIPEGRGIISQL